MVKHSCFKPYLIAKPGLCKACTNAIHRVNAVKRYRAKKEADPDGYRVIINQKRHEWLEKTPGYHKDYRKRNPIANRMRAIKTAAKKRGKEMLLTDGQIKELIANDSLCIK